MQLSREVKIGFTATLILAASLWGINFLKGKNILKPSDNYYVTFDQIDGLIESGSVYHRGFKVGNINGIEFDTENTNQFILGITLEQRLKIPINSLVSVKSSSLIASANDLEIIFSEEKNFHVPGDTLNSKTSEGIADILEPMQQRLTSILWGVDTMINSINKVLNTNGVQDLQSSLASLNHSLQVLSADLSPQGSLSKTLDNVESISTNIKGKNQQIAESIDHFSSISAQLDSANIKNTISRLDSTLNQLSQISQKINDGTGTAGKLMNDSSLYTHLDSTSYYLSMLLKDMQENPKRYVHFSLFGKKESNE